ncbi:adenylyltransferase/cytidyltransferase family protein [Parendozoicomonas haliclonae]|uniref:nicotinate-nucleotide adenylyltransferase n=2 Tax=Parendozoicomonas haliclonae TaxID=1960125 RepID=A0A1X7AJE9_9GAMM|nr:Nicotinate-nucleotide adenylyltransferase [Parendozoicomonas haliclonae]
MKRTGVFGSAFNPPTRGHLDVLRQAAPRFDKILLLPSVAHAFNKETIPLQKRLELLEAFCRDVEELPCKLEISTLEEEILASQPDSPVYTWSVLNTLSNQEPATEFTFIRGPDNAAQETWQRFYRYQDIERRWSIFTADESVSARSSYVRELLCQPEPELNLLQKWLTPSVMAMILEQRLYQANASIKRKHER